MKNMIFERINNYMYKCSRKMHKPLITLVFFCALFLCLNIYLDEVKNTNNKVNAATTIEYDVETITMMLDDEGVFTVSGYGTLTTDFPWKDYVDTVTKIVFDVTEGKKMYAPSNCTRMFLGMVNVIEIDLKSLDTTNVTNMSFMFDSCTKLKTLDMSNFNTSKVTTLDATFNNCSSLTYLDVSGFDTKNVTAMPNTFHGCKVLEELDVSNFDTSNVRSFCFTFGDCESLTKLDVSNFDTSNTEYLNGTFSGCENLIELDVSNFNTEKVIDMSFLFNDCECLTTLNLNKFNTSSVIDMAYMFSGCISITSLNLKSFDTSNVKNMSGLFSGNTSLKDLQMNFDTSNVTDMNYMFSSCESFESLDWLKLNTSNVTSMEGMFASCSGLKSIDFSKIKGFDTSNVTSMESFFDGCASIEKINLKTLDTKNVLNFSSMFAGCSKLKQLELGNFNTSSATNMEGMFESCMMIESLDLTSFNTSNVEDMSSMFSGCSNLKSLNVDSFNTSNVKNMLGMFSMSKALEEIDLRSFDTSNVEDMSSMFSGCNSLKSLNLSTFSTGNLKKIDTMFSNCFSLKELDLSNFDLSNITEDTSVISEVKYEEASTMIKTMFSLFLGIPEEKMTDDANLIDLFVEIALEMGMEMEDLGDIESIKEEAKEQFGIDLTIRNVLNVTGIDESYMYEGSYGIEVLKTPINVPKNVSLGKTMYDKDTKENFTNLPLNESTSRTLVTTLVRYYDGIDKDKIVSYEFVGYNQDAVYENKNYNIWYEKETGIETKLRNIIAPIDVYGELRIDCDAVSVTHDETTYLITVTDRGTELIQETDYKVTYVENKETGEITAIIEGINRYIGTREYIYEGSFSDSTNPKILKISSKPGVYKRYQKMPITVEFDKDVILENGAQMSIMIKGKNGEEYSNLEKTKITYNVKKDVPSKEKTFEYKVKSGDLALNGLEVTELEIIGAGFKDEYNNLMEPSVNLKEVVCNFDTTYINAANVLKISMTSSKNNETMITFSFENEVVNDSFTKEDILVTINGKEVSASSLGELTTEDNKNYTLKFKMPQNANNQLLMVSVLSEASEDVNGNTNLSYTNKLEVKGTGNVNGSGYKNSTFTIEFPGGNVTNKVNVSSKIDKEIKSYMTGYKDGTFRPNDTLTRAEVAAILARISKDYSDKQSYIEKVNYQDVSKDLWSSNYIGYMQEEGIMTGTSNYFRPNAKITRAEFTRAIVRMLGLKSNDLGSNKFLDATNKWYEKDAILLSNLGYINGYPDNTFGGNKEITRAEACKIINQVMGSSIDEESKEEKAKEILDKFKDISKDSWYFEEVMESMY